MEERRRWLEGGARAMSHSFLNWCYYCCFQEAQPTNSNCQAEVESHFWILLFRLQSLQTYLFRYSSTILSFHSLLGWLIKIPPIQRLPYANQHVHHWLHFELRNNVQKKRWPTTVTIFRWVRHSGCESCRMLWLHSATAYCLRALNQIVAR